jgi:uncharacterized protein (UPF0332 family)
VADFIDHLNQAKHNLESAQKFLQDRTIHDWAITAAFYSAVHFVEAGFISIPTVIHTETAVPSDISDHTFRQNQVRENYGNVCYLNYRKLRIASENVRYLWPSRIGLSSEYYSLADVNDFVNNVLSKIRNEIQLIRKIDLS